MDEKLRKILIGAAIAVAGALLTYASDAIVPFLAEHPSWGPALAGVAAIAINAARKWLQGAKDGGSEANG
jgi:hypothetical protein